MFGDGRIPIDVGFVLPPTFFPRGQPLLFFLLRVLHTILSMYVQLYVLHTDVQLNTSTAWQA